MKNLVRQLCILIIFRLIVAQLNTNKTQLQNDFHQKGRSIGYSKTVKWFKLSKMSNFAKFMLCVDVLQKMEKTYLMGGQYVTEKPNLELPYFQLKSKRIENISADSSVIHCPLHTIKFEKLSYKTGAEFYLTDSAKRLCVYVLKPNENSSGLSIIAEVCGILVNMRYNREELDAEIKSRLKSSSKDLNWPELNHMSDENKFAICMEFYEQNSYRSLYTSDRSMPNIEPSIFEIKKYFYLVFSDRKIWKGEVHTLLCPMNQLNFSVSYRSAHIGLSSPPFYLAKSINYDCIYKVNIIKTTDQYHTDKEHETGVSIQAELCGIFGPKTTNALVIHYDLIQKWKSVNSYYDTSYPPSEFSNMKAAHLTQICLNVYRKLFHKRKLSITTNYSVNLHDLPLRIITDRILYVSVKTFKCFSFSENINLLNSFNLGCVYILTNTIIDHPEVYEIKAEICEVYSNSQFLEFHGKSFQPKNFVIGIE